MNLIKRTIARSLGLALMLALCVVAGLAQQGQGQLRGTITDEFGGALVGATVTVVSSSGVEKSAVTNDEGVYVVSGLAPGAYTVRAVATGFAMYENTEVQVVAGRNEPLDVKLSVTIEEQKVTVSGDQRGVSTESENNADAIVLRGKDLDALPDDPDDLALRSAPTAVRFTLTASRADASLRKRPYAKSASARIRSTRRTTAPASGVSIFSHAPATTVGAVARISISTTRA
jgi:hypothetical protein